MCRVRLGDTGYVYPELEMEGARVDDIEDCLVEEAFDEVETPRGESTGWLVTPVRPPAVVVNRDETRDDDAPAPGEVDIETP